jgi:hypothetical protein
MANLYDRPVGGQFIDTYVPIPFEQIAQAGARRQERYDVAKQGMEQVYDAAQALRYIPGSEDERLIKENVIPRIEEIRDKYAKQDLSNPLVQRQMRKELETKVSKNLVGETQQSYAQWLEDEKLVRQYKAKGLWHPALDAQRRGQGYSTQDEGVYSRISSPYVNPMQEVDQLFRTQGYMKGRDLYNEKTGVVTNIRDTEDVKNIADTKWYELSENAKSNILMDMQYRNPDLDISTEEARTNAIKQFIAERGETAWTWKDVQRGWQPRVTQAGGPTYPWMNPIDIGRNIQLQGLEEIPAIPLEKTPLSSFRFDEQGNVKKYDLEKEVERVERTKLIGISAGALPWPEGKDVKEVEKDIDVRFEKQTEVLNMFREKFPVYTDSTDEEVHAAYSQTLAAMNNRAMNKVQLPPEVSEAQTDELIQNITDRKIQIVDSQGTIFDAPINASGSSNTIKKKLGMTMTQFEEAIKARGVSSYTNDLERAMTAYIQGIEGKGGEMYDVFMDTSDTMQKYGAVSNRAYRAYISLDDTPFPVEYERDETGQIVNTIYLRPVYPKDPTQTTNPQFETGYMTPDGFTPIGTRSLNEIQEMDYARMLASPTIFTDINYYTGQKPRPAHF